MIAIIYVRKSLVKKGAPDPASPAMQEAACRELAAAQGWTPEVYADAEGHRSGKSARNRPGWAKARARLDDADTVALIVYAYSRAFRNVKLLLDLVDELQAGGKRIVAVKDSGMNPYTSRGRMMMTFAAAFDEGESNEASERRIETIEYLRRTKGRHYGLPPFGAIRKPVDGDLVLHPNEREQPNGTDHQALTRCYELYCEGRLGYWPLAHQLNAEGWRYRDRDGNLRNWSLDDVRRALMSHWLYAGYVTIGRAYRDQVEILRGSHAPILPEALTAPVAARLSQHERGKPKLRSNNEYPLTGLLYCACGERLRGNITPRGRAYRHVYKCTIGNRVENHADLLEVAAREHIARLRIPSHIVQQETAAVVRLVAAESSARPVDAERTRIEGALQRLNELYVEGLIDRPAYDRRRAEMLGQLPAEPALPGPASALLSLDLAQAMRDCPPAALRDMVRGLYEKVEVVDREENLRFVPRLWCAEWA